MLENHLAATAKRRVQCAYSISSTLTMLKACLSPSRVTCSSDNCTMFCGGTPNRAASSVASLRSVSNSRSGAEAVKSYLVSKGIDAKRLDAVGYGSEHPLALDRPEDPSNRRVEIKDLGEAHP